MLGDRRREPIVGGADHGGGVAHGNELRRVAERDHLAIDPGRIHRRQAIGKRLHCHLHRLAEEGQPRAILGFAIGIVVIAAADARHVRHFRAEPRRRGRGDHGIADMFFEADDTHA
jgi:hypothetical protein